MSLHIIGEVCAALDYAHRCEDELGRLLQIVHRDVSPQNVLISTSGEVKLADFGIAKAAFRTSDTDVGTIKGKYYYMSPEQAWGDPLDHRSDIFSAGVLLWELLTGESLHKKADVRSLLKAVRSGDVPPPSTVRPDLPTEIEQIVMRAVAPKREARFQSAESFRDACTGYLARSRMTVAPARVADLIDRFHPFQRPPSDTIATQHSTQSMVSAMRSNEYKPDSDSVLFNLDELSDPQADPTTPAASWEGDTIVEDSAQTASTDTQPGKREIRVAPAPPPRNSTAWLPMLLAFGLGALGAFILFRPASIPPTVQVESIPSGAVVELDGRAMGKTPVTITEGLEVGTMASLRVHAEGHEPWTTSVQPMRQPLHYNAVLQPHTYTLKIESEPAGAYLTVDGVARGRAPMSLEGLRWGAALKIVATARGYRPLSRSVAVTETTVKAPLVFKLRKKNRSRAPIVSEKGVVD